MARAALYARYSDDKQSPNSIEDQFRICRMDADKQAWRTVGNYSDAAISGSTLIMRPGIQALLRDAMAGKFDVVLAEALDRLSRDQEDIAGLFKRLRFAGVRIVTLSEGEISELHVGLKGTMNALFLKDLAAKTHRGIRGRVEAGKVGCGNAYGYRVVREIDAAGKVTTGEREIIPDEAEVVRRIFREYAEGRSPRRIAIDLNREGNPILASLLRSDIEITTAGLKRFTKNSMWIGKTNRYAKDIVARLTQDHPLSTERQRNLHACR